jgi:hypothetical protein
MPFTVTLCLCLAVLAATPAVAAGVPMSTWTYGDKTSGFKSGPVQLSFGQGRDADGAAVPVLAIRSKGTAPFTVVGEHGTNPVSASWAVAELDRTNATPEVVFSSFTGGAHCCHHIFIAERLKDGWTAFDLGMLDGDGLAAIRDVDGDGVSDIELIDQRFLYAFSDYATSWAPPVLVNVSGGKVEDVSKSQRYRKFYAAWAARAKTDCAQHKNGACAGYAAAAARAGAFDAAWTFILANYDKTARWDLPLRCTGQIANGDCMGRAIKPKDFPQALRWFLEDSGYIPKGK